MVAAVEEEEEGVDDVAEVAVMTTAMAEEEDAIAGDHRRCICYVELSDSKRFVHCRLLISCAISIKDAHAPVLDVKAVDLYRHCP